MSAREIDAEIVIPNLEIEVQAKVSKSNFAEFKRALDAKIASYPTKLDCDEDFAEAKENKKELATIRGGIRESRELLIKQAGDLNELLEGLSDSDDAARRQVKILTDQITKETGRIKSEILEEAFEKSEEFTTGMQGRIEGAMKSKRTIESLRKAAFDEADAIVKEIETVDDILASFDESIRYNRASLLAMSPDAVTAELERRKQAQEAAIREAKLKEQLEAEKKKEESPVSVAEKPPEQAVYKPKLDGITVATEKPKEMTVDEEARAFLASVPAIFGQFKATREKLIHPENAEPAKAFAQTLNSAWSELKNELER